MKKHTRLQLLALLLTGSASLVHAGQTCCKLPTPSVSSATSTTSSFSMPARPNTPRPIVTRPNLPGSSTSAPVTPTIQRILPGLPSRATY
jgi:hypothetical protein